MRVILGIQVGDREHEAVKVQELLTKHGCIIKTRLGLHEASTVACSSKGLILLEFLPDSEAEIDSIETELSSLESVVVRKMVF
ncbi:MAG TPA: hypothetical protein DCG34_11040 [Clostridiales bacterium]|jgi:uncharacterized protein YqgQ|nr:hypothetical protein [Clostridiales bacterium]